MLKFLVTKSRQAPRFPQGGSRGVACCWSTLLHDLVRVAATGVVVADKHNNAGCQRRIDDDLMMTQSFRSSTCERMSAYVW